MSDFEGFEENGLPEDARRIVRARVNAPGPVHAAVRAERLLEGSPKPFKGRPHPKYPELDSLDNLYLPRYLIREWGEERFQRSPYYKAWVTESGRRQRLSADPKAGYKK